MTNVEPLTADERQYIEKLFAKVGPRMIKAKTCYRTAQLLMLHDEGKRLHYWECGHPIPHAWVTKTKFDTLSTGSETQMFHKHQESNDVSCVNKSGCLAYKCCHRFIKVYTALGP